MQSPQTSDTEHTEEDNETASLVSNPTDERKTYFLFFGLGLATLLPWNLFISASEFYHHQFAHSPHQDTFQNSFSLVYMATNFAFNLYAMATVTRSDANQRIWYGLLINTLAYLVGVIMPVMESWRGSLSFYITMAQLFATAAASGLLNNSLFALTAHFMPAHSEGVLSGQAVAGIIATAAQLITAYSVSNQTSKGLANRTIAYFMFATLVNSILTLAFYRIKTANQYYQQRSKLAHDNRRNPELTTNESTDQIGEFCQTIVIIFAVTIAVFPSTTALVTPVSGFKLLAEWHFFIFNLGDLLGRRYAPRLPVSRPIGLLALALLRILFVPVFLTSHTSFSVWYNWIQSDVLFLAMVGLLGVSNGVVSTRAALMGLANCRNPTVAGAQVAISISTGLVVGSLLSWAVRAIGCLCSPI